jgi:hypothetical protein
LNLSRKITTAQNNWDCGSSGRPYAKQEQGPKFNPMLKKTKLFSADFQYIYIKMICA